MKSKIVLVIAMLLLVSILAVSTLFIINASSEYEEIVKEESKQNEKEETPPKEEELPTDKPDDSGEGGDSTKPAPVVEPMLDGYFSASPEKSYRGYSWVVTDQYQAWQPMDGISGGSTVLLTHFEDGLWSVENKNPGWVSDPLLSFSYVVDGVKEEPSSVFFYYQLCINGVWQDELHPMDGSLFSAYVCIKPLYSEMNDFSIHDAVKSEDGVYYLPRDYGYLENKVYVSVCLENELPANTYVNFYMEFVE